MSTSISPIILCGGSGTRLWPMSRKARPKPFLPLLGDRTLFQQSLDRVADNALFGPPVIVAGAAHVEWIDSQADAAGGARLIVEPAARNTAPAIALAAHALPRDTVMLVCPSDQHIADQAAFLDGVARAAALARAGHMVAFGIHPTRPETGYGYIAVGEALGEAPGEEHQGGNRIARFVEKPDLARAQAYLASGDYVWNGGIFAFAAGAYLDELARHRPDMAALAARAANEGRTDGWRIHPAAAPFEDIAGESIDYAVMENTDRAAVVAADMGWSDIGNWDALLDARDCDAAGCSVDGRIDLVGCSNVLVRSDGPRVSAIGLKNIVIVVDGDEVLVTTREGAQAVGKLPGASSQ